MAKLTGKQKALTFLKALGDAASQKVLQALPEELAEKIILKLNEFPEPAPEAVAMVYRELNQYAIEPKPAVPELEVAASSHVEHLSTAEEINRVNPKQLLLALQDEQAHTIAFFLKYLGQSLREGYLNLLSPGRRHEIERARIEELGVAPKLFEVLAKKVLHMQAH
jgi:flagellar motor switch protein FliG